MYDAEKSKRTFISLDTVFIKNNDVGRMAELTGIDYSCTNLPFTSFTFIQNVSEVPDAKSVRSGGRVLLKLSVGDFVRETPQTVVYNLQFIKEKKILR